MYVLESLFFYGIQIAVISTIAYFVMKKAVKDAIKESKLDKK